MKNFANSVSIAALTLALSSGALATTENVANPPASDNVANPPAASAPAAAKPATPPLTSESTKPALSPQDTAVAEKLRELIETKLSRHVTRERDRAGVTEFYRDRGFAPLWVGNNAALPRAKDAIAFLRGVEADGLAPADYPTPNFLDSSPDALAAHELALTQSVLTFVRHASTGRVAFSRASGAVYFDQKFPNAGEVLSGLAAAGNIRIILDSFNPQHAAYKALKAELAAERRRNESVKDIVRVPDGPLLRPGMEDARVPILRQRLKLTPGDGRLYDDALVEAVKAFQDKSSLNPDGVVGPNTLARLNGESRLDRVQTIIANMERWRWMPHEFGAAYVMVNVPDYRLKVVKNDSTVWSTRIVVGKPGRYATPLLTETMKYITVNPTWNVPPSIIRNEYLPALQQDPGALERIGLRMGRNADGSLRIYQPPGERNALGRLRFNFPNRFLVYQHDTPDKHLFEKEARAFSHGCMRVKDPDRYAEVLLSVTQPEDGYSAERIRALYGRGERTIQLKTHIPVYITYQTAFVDDAGKVQFRPDIYGLDKEVAALLNGDRRIADVPVARNYSSGSGPVTAQIPTWRRYGYDYEPFGGGDWDDDGVPIRRQRFDRFRPW